MVLVFVTFWYFFYFVKFVCGEMLASKLWKSLLFLTHSSWVFSHESFACFLPTFEYHFNSLFLTFITGACSEIPCSVDSQLHEIPTWCKIWVWRILKQITKSFISFLFLFTCTLLLYNSSIGIIWERGLPTS